MKFHSTFVEIIKEYSKIIFSKSQLPEIRKNKSAAILDMTNKYREILHTDLTEPQLSKKNSKHEEQAKNRIRCEQN